MEFVVFFAKVLFGSFILFTIARKTYVSWLPDQAWRWVALVGFLALVNMLIHRLLGSTINPPFYTSVLFAVTLFGLMQADEETQQSKSSEVSRWLRRGVTSVAVGTAVGWLSFVQIHSAG